MGLRYRKSIKLGPFRLNLSKSGVGYSVGVKGYRVTKKASGGYRTTASVPGTGVSHVTEHSPKTDSSSPGLSAPPPEGFCPNCSHPVSSGNSRCPECGTKIKRKRAKLGKGALCAILLSILFILVLAAGGSNQPSAATQEQQPQPDASTAQTDPVDPVAPEPNLQPAPAPAPEPEPAPAPTPEPKPEPAPMSGPEPEPGPELAPTVAYIGNANSKKFHELSCGSVDEIKDTNKVDLFSRDDAIARGYDPCKRCDP